jgi:quinol monooxygenase YgiN
MRDSVIVTAFLRGKAGREEELESRLHALVRASRLDPGVVTYDLHHSIEDRATWFLYERYESQEHFKRHVENSVLRRFLADATTFVEGSPDVRFQNGVRTTIAHNAPRLSGPQLPSRRQYGSLPRNGSRTPAFCHDRNGEWKRLQAVILIFPSRCASQD